jgi:hypothetical protein
VTDDVIEIIEVGEHEGLTYVVMRRGDEVFVGYDERQ